MTLSKEQIKNRVVYVGDRIAFGVALAFGLVILMAYILQIGNITSDNAPSAPPFLYPIL